MAEEKAPIIIKRIKKGGHGAHGGAWKVAFADFMTAMMCFFLVMWLMGADEATKSAIADYFTTATIFKGGSDSLGKNGSAPNSAYSLLNGQEGGFDEKNVNEPARPRPVYLIEHKTLSQLVNEVFDGNAFEREYDAEKLKFAIPGNLIFQWGKTEISYEGKQYLKRLAEVFKNYEGEVQIIGHTEKGEGENEEAQWQLAFKRALVIRSSLVKDFNVNADQLIPTAVAKETLASSDATPEEVARASKLNRRVEFVLKHANN